VALPAVNGTIARIGFVGQSCAVAAAQQSAVASSAGIIQRKAAATPASTGFMAPPDALSFKRLFQSRLMILNACANYFDCKEARMVPARRARTGCRRSAQRFLRADRRGFVGGA
jgi:hypothetical protein